MVLLEVPLFSPQSAFEGCILAGHETMYIHSSLGGVSSLRGWHADGLPAMLRTFVFNTLGIEDYRMVQASTVVRRSVSSPGACELIGTRLMLCAFLAFSWLERSNS